MICVGAKSRGQLRGHFRGQLRGQARGRVPSCPLTFQAVFVPCPLDCPLMALVLAYPAVKPLRCRANFAIVSKIFKDGSELAHVVSAWY